MKILNPTQAATDAIGQAHAPHIGVPRIVSLVPSLTELVFALGLGEHLVGRTGFCIHPAQAVRKVAKVGGTKDIKLARILALRPTHVLVNVDENRREDADSLRAAGINLVVTHPLGPTDNLVLYDLLGTIFGVHEAAQQMSAELDRAITSANSAYLDAAALQVLYLIWKKPWMSISADTYIARMLALGGLHAIAIGSEARYPEVANDAPAWRQIDAILLSSEPYPFREKHQSALREHVSARVMLVDGELLSWYGARAIAGVEYVTKLSRQLRIQANQ